MASMLYNYFSSVFNVPADDLFSNNDSDTNDGAGNVPLSNLEHTLPNFVFNTEEVLKAINDLKANKNPDLGNIYTKLLKERKSEIVDAFIFLFNLPMRRGIVSDDWKSENITPIIRKR